MSINLEVIPTIAKTLYWKNIRVRLEALLETSARGLLGEQPQLRHLGSKLVVRDDEALSYPNYYSFDLAFPNALSLSIDGNKDIGVNERGELEAYGRNLAPETIRQLTEIWKVIGYSFEASCPMGHSSEEALLLVCIATILANACDGYVISTGDYGYIEKVSGLGVGVYTAEEFRQVIPHFERRLGQHR